MADTARQGPPAPGKTAPTPGEATGLQADHPHPGGAEMAAAPHPQDNLRQDPELTPTLWLGHLEDPGGQTLETEKEPGRTSGEAGPRPPSHRSLAAGRCRGQGQLYLPTSRKPGSEIPQETL